MTTTPSGEASAPIRGVVEPQARDLPIGTTFVADRSLRWLPGPLLSGGAPWRLCKLTDRGRALVLAWLGGAPLGTATVERALARRLVDAGLLHPASRGRAARPGEVVVIVPVRDDAEALDRLLGGLVGFDVVVVDDGSLDADEVASIAAGRAEVLRRGSPGGPGAARNTGFAATASPLVAFVDADASPSSGWLDGLIAHFDDPLVAAAAPRVVGDGVGGALARFEVTASPLDMGQHGGVVRPGASVAFVPAAVLVVRRDAIDAPFDDRLRVGEDVDFVWRLDEAGWLVRYDPNVVVGHATRPTVRAWVAQRIGYGRSAASLEARHGDAAAPVRADARVVGTLALLATGHPKAALAMLAWSTAALAERLDGLLEGPRRDATAIALASRGTVLAVPTLARSVVRSYGVVLVGSALVCRPLRRPVTAALLASAAVRWWRAGRPPSPLGFAAVSIADDVSYSAGVVIGALEARRLGALRPRLRVRPSATVREGQSQS